MAKTTLYRFGNVNFLDHAPMTGNAELAAGFEFQISTVATSKSVTEPHEHVFLANTTSHSR